jgi:hypothetical protein
MRPQVIAGDAPKLTPRKKTARRQRTANKKRCRLSGGGYAGAGGRTPNRHRTERAQAESRIRATASAAAKCAKWLRPLQWTEVSDEAGPSWGESLLNARSPCISMLSVLALLFVAVLLVLTLPSAIFTIATPAALSGAALAPTATSSASVHVLGPAGLGFATSVRTILPPAPGHSTHCERELRFRAV